METATRLLEIKDTLDKNVNIFEFILISSILSTILLFIILRVYVDHKEFANSKSKRNIWIGFWLYVVFAGGSFVFSIVEEDKLYEERFVLEKEYIQSLTETDVVKIDTIVMEQIVPNKLCRMLESNSEDNCSLVEFVSDNDFYQFFIPLTKEEQIQIQEGTQLTYLKLSERDRHFLNEYLSRGDLIVGTGTIDFTELVKNKEAWSFGLSLHN